MQENKTDYKTIDEYILAFSPAAQQRLIEVRNVIKKAAPEAQEKISWSMPTFFENGNLVHFAMHKKHIGLYPGVSAIENFKDELSEYETSKGAIQFPLEKPIPYDLIEKIVKFRVEENKKLLQEKSKKK